MKKIVVSLLAISCLIACSEKKKENTLPAPATVAEVVKLVAGKTYSTERIGTVSPFSDKMDKEKPNRWFDEEKELNDFAKKFQIERMKFILSFVNDTLLKVTDDGKTWDAVYTIDEEIRNEEKTGMKLRFTYPDKEGTMSFPGATEPMMLTSTYFIAGINNKAIVLETPREFNRSTVVVWMKVE